MILETHNIDCIDGMASLEDQCVDVVVTSPPYNIGTGYNSYKDQLPLAEYMEWSMEWISEVHRVLAHDGSFFLNIGAASKFPEIPYLLVGRILTSRLFVLQNTIQWVKSIAIPGEDGVPVSRGHFKPINSKRYLNGTHEAVFHFTLRGDVELDRLAIGVPYADKSNVRRWATTGGRDLRCGGNSWFIPYKTIQRKGQRPHPATFPVQLPLNCILLHGKENSTVMDPFTGLGSTGVAAAQAGASKFIGFELDPDYIHRAELAIRAAADAAALRDYSGD